LEKDAQDTKAMITDAQKKKEKRDKEFELERKRSEAIQAKMEEERARKRTILTEPDSGSDSDSDKETNAIVCTTSLSDEETKHQFITDRDKIIDDFFESDRWAKMIPTEQKKYLDLIDLHCYNTPIEQQSLDAFKKIFKV
jgi:Fe-S cluster assembly ATPase SufC